ncbi:uncharacterized protein [Pyxicephalus adspersus]|uniref:uncharacterized protein n=1 Tax=Pyxicephalus adspersus TaxID=30357 RepID=UPI003B59DE51
MDLADVRWSASEYTLQEYVSKFQSSFPNIIKITEGFLGKQEIDSVSSSTVIRVHSLYNQSRITAETRSGKLFSLPIKMTRLKFLVPKVSSPVAALNNQIPMTLEEILPKYTLPVTVRTATVLSYKQKGDMKSQDEMLSELTLQDTYEEMFLFGHPIEKGKIFLGEPMIIPMYMTQLKLVVALGYKNGSVDKWHSLCEFLTQQVKNHGSTENVSFEEILMLDKKDVNPQEPSYSTIEPIYIDINEINNDKKTPLNNNASRNVYQDPFVKTESPSGNSFKSIHDVPKDLHSLTVKQVCECLTFLNMSQYTKAFKESQVDGQLVYELNQEMMKSCLGMNGLNAVKFLKFRDGWRPNLQG